MRPLCLFVHMLNSVTQFKQALNVMFSLCVVRAGARDHNGFVNRRGQPLRESGTRQVEPIRDLTSNFSGLAVTMTRY